MKKLDKDALLEEAKRRYPVGTKFKVVHSPETIRKVTSHEKHADTFVKASDGLHINFISDLIEGGKSSCISASVYFNGKWAEIIEEPKVETKFEKGKWYYYEHGGSGQGKYYLRCNEYTSDKFYYTEYIKLIKNAKAIKQVADVPFKFMYNIKEVSLSEIQQYLPAGHPDKIKEFVLPEKWCIKSTDEADETLIKWREGEYTIRPAYLCSDKYWINEDTSKKYTEITFEQFKKYVLKDNVKEEVKSMKEWSVGSYVVWLIEIGSFGIEVGTVDEISKTVDSRGMGSTKLVGSTAFLQRNNKDLKWFPTLQEAQKFSDELLGKSKTSSDKGNLMESKEYPEYYECISRDNENFTKGKIYKILNPEDLEAEYNFIDDLGGKNGWSGRNYKHFKPSTKEAYEAQFKKDEEFKVGDWIVIEDSCKLENGCIGCPEGIFKIIKDTKEHIHGLVRSNNTYLIQTSNAVWRISNQGVRKALPHEIPVENSVTQSPLIFEDCSKLDFEVKWKEPRYIGGVDPISVFSWGIFEQMKKQSPQSRKTPDLIDKTKVEVKIKRTKVKQIKL